MSVNVYVTLQFYLDDIQWKVAENTQFLHLKAPVEKGRKWWFEVKIEIAPI